MGGWFFVIFICSAKIKSSLILNLNMKKTLLIVAGIMMMSACMSQEIEPNEPEPELELELEREPEDEKPVLYFYPKETTEIEVKLDYQGEFTFTYPEYNNGWNMIAHPDGTLVDPKTNRSYNYLFWEGQLKRESIDEGFVVKGSEVVPFLEEKLSTLGLNSKEQADFITYWGTSTAKKSLQHCEILRRRV